MNNFTTTGVDGIDQIISGGFPEGSTIILEGAPGTGKTTIGVQFLYNGAIKANEPGLYITFEEFPQQIYQDMLNFGWDLRELEKQNMLRVVSIKPDVLLKQMKEPNGLFEQLIEEIGCKRIVIDSISLFHFIYTNPHDYRDQLYNLRNILRKFSLTSLLLSEQTQGIADSVSFEHYVVDGVIRLSLAEQMTKFRKRTLEVQKMRGRRIVEGEHIYRITDQGIHLIPALSMVGDTTITTKNHIPTGIPKLDQLLSGGIPRGSAMIVDTNSKANYKFLTGSIVTQSIKKADRVISLPSSLTTAHDNKELFQLYDLDIRELCQNKRLYFIEHYNRPIPPELEGAVIDVKDLSNDEYVPFLEEKLAPIIREGLENGDHWFVYYDLNTIFSFRGAEFVKRFFAEEIAWARGLNITILALCNFTEIGVETASFIERTANGVIRTWVDGNYQFLQVTKSPSGYVSEPQIVENISESPFIRLV